MTEQATPVTGRTPTDWEPIERLYRAGMLSIREIGREYDISDKAIRNKAKAAGWERDLTQKVSEQVRAELVRSESAASPRTEREIVEAAAATVVQVVRSHRVRIKQGNALVELLTKQLTDVASKRDAFESAIELECAEDKSPARMAKLMAAVSLGSHASIAVNLANATKTWVGLERQAFGLKDNVEDGKAPMDETQLNDRLAYLMSK